VATFEKLCLTFPETAMPSPLSPKAPALITGGSSGIGLAMARLLVRTGRPVAIMGRDALKLSDAEAELRALNGGEVLTCRGDVGQYLDVQHAVDATLNAFGPLGLAIANAGIAKPGHFVQQPLTDHIAQMQTNYFGSLHLAEAAITSFAIEGGRLVFVSSGAALVGVHGYSAYAPSKYAIRGLAEVLRVELAARRVSVTVAFPPDTDTPQLIEEAKTKPASTKRFTEGGGIFSADVVARDILKAAMKGQFQVTTGASLKVLMRLQDLLGPYLRWEQRRAIKAEGSLDREGRI
jgi:3-dehydrosphinganine reductase